MHDVRVGGWRLGTLVVLALTGLVAGGCPSPSRGFVTPERLEAGLVVSLDGIGGYNWGPQWLRSGLHEAGVRAAIIIYDWSKGPSAMFVGDLMDPARNRAIAQDLARMVSTYAAAMPNRPVTLIGHSGGAAVVVWALENLPEGCCVERAILLAPALAPGYDLSPALRGVRSRLYVMHSQADLGLMGAGTAVFGTMDREHTVSAGLVGFRVPDAPKDVRQYTKVRQVPWSIGLLKMGHLGGHMGWTTTRFAREYLAPILLGASDPGQPLAVVRPSPGTSGPGAAAPVPPVEEQPHANR